MKIKKQKPMKRGAGVLLPITSIPSPHGIGTFGAEAFAFVDFLKRAGQTYWQVLPLGPTSYGDSPYQSFSAFAGNPYFLDLDFFVEQGLLQPEEVESHNWGENPACVDYARIYQERFPVLKKAFDRSNHLQTVAYQEFCDRNRDWLEEYSQYMAIKMHFEGKSWLEWPRDIRMRKPEAVSQYQNQLSQEISFWKFCQFVFDQQWKNLKAYANQQGIQIIGDIPIYVALDSADVWAHSESFQLDEEHRPVKVAGVPPDLFSKTGQLWGNPLYNWEKMEKEEFAWWKRRMAFLAEWYDVIRIDHFVGIAHYYSIPAGEKTAENGEWVTGPGEKLLAAIGSVIGEKRIIAEDLGIVTPAVRRMLRRSGYPGMKLLEFAFDSDSKNEYLPCNYEKNTVVYGGTHDNETMVSFFSGQSRKVLQFAKKYLNVRKNSQIPWEVLRAGYASVANTVIFQMQDYLQLDNRARMNTPSTIGDNWKWRLVKDQLTGELEHKMKELAVIYGRE